MGQRNGLRSCAARDPRAHVIAARFGRAVTAMVLALGFLAVGMPATPAAAVQATGGTARFPSIEWFSWGANARTISNDGESRTEHYTIAGQAFDITCTLSNIALASGTATGSYLESYLPGTWQGDGFDELYNIGGDDGANTMVVGLSNHTQGTAVSLDFSCSATLAGNDFPLAGLVMADAEASGSSEYVGATIPTSATWRILDRVRGASCTLDTYARRTVTGSANRLELYGPVANTCENGSAAVRPGPSAVAFMDGATSATGVTISGIGKSAIALGVAFNTDFGDAPASYGNAGAALQFAYTGGEIPPTSNTETLAENRGTPVFGEITLATNVQPPLRLGSKVDPEATEQYSDDATGDDTTGEPASGGPDDENGVTLTNPIEVAPGGTAVIGPVACSGKGYVAGWIDWNDNGVFDDATERSTTSPACPDGGGRVDLNFDVPSTILGSGGTINSFLRLRIAPAVAQLTPAGLSTGGEVEDYRLVAGAKPRIILRATTLGGVGGPYGFTLTNTAQASGTVTTTTAGTATQVDGDTATSDTEPFLLSTTSAEVTINESAIPDNWALSSATCSDGTNKVGSLSGTTFTLPASAVGPGAVITCDFRNGQPSIGLVKTADTVTRATEGSPVPYTFTVTNTGQTPLRSIAISDLKVATVTCDSTTLAIGASTTCTGSHALTQAEVDAGTVVNNASVTATPPSGPVVTATASTTTTIQTHPAITLAKTAGTPSGNRVGATIDYTFLVTNTGNVTLSDIGITDPLVDPVSCGSTTLNPGADTTCTKAYSLTQADVDAGTVTNTATVSGTSPAGDSVTALGTVTTVIPAAPKIRFDKQVVVPAGGAVVGARVDYTFVVTNIGNVSLSGVGVTDSKVSVDCLASGLAPGESTSCTRPYVVTQADVDSGHVANVATAVGSHGVVPAVPVTDSTDVNTDTGAGIALVKSGALVGAGVGDRIDYSFLVTNTGKVTLSSISVADPQLAAVVCPVTPLAPTMSMTCTGAYTLTQDDVDAGSVVNTATATADTPTGDKVSATGKATSPIIASPGIDLVKSGTVNGEHAGDTIDYTFAVTNTGNVTLAAVEVTDAKAGTVTCPDTTLAPGASTTCTATYLLTQADADTGLVHNEATVAGTPPTGDPVTATDAVDLLITPGPSITLDKHAGAPSSAQAGGTIEYTFEVTNSGNVTLAAVAVADAKVGTVTCPVDALAPGESTTCTARYALTQADVDAGTVVNTASVTGTPQTGEPVTDDDTVTTPIAQLPALSLDKSADVMAEVVEGDLVNFTFVVTNIGNVTLNNVALVDPMLASLACPTTSLVPGASMTCTGSPYAVTAADVKLGHVTNVAGVSSSYCPTAGCVPVHADDSVTVTTAAVKGATDSGGNGHGGHGGLAYTGLSGAPELVALGGGILAAGVLLLVAARRRRSGGRYAPRRQA